MALLGAPRLLAPLCMSHALAHSPPCAYRCCLLPAPRRRSGTPRCARIARRTTTTSRRACCCCCWGVRVWGGTGWGRVRRRRNPRSAALASLPSGPLARTPRPRPPPPAVLTAQVFALAEGGAPTGADITDDRLAIRIPNAPSERAGPQAACLGACLVCASLVTPVHTTPFHTRLPGLPTPLVPPPDDAMK